MSVQAVSYNLEGPVAVIRMDDGKANALSHAVLDGLIDAFDRAEADDAGAIALIGREGRFSAGFDLTVMQAGIDKALEILKKGADLAMRVYESPRPIVFGVTGHALAMGAVLLMTADERIGAAGQFKVGLNEVAIGMTLPDFALVLADERLSRRHLYEATSAARIYTPAEAVDVGFLDRVVDPDQVGSEAIARATQMAETLHAKAHANTKRALRKDTVARLHATLTELS